MNYTTIEQSIHLEKLGLDIMTADMFYNEEPDESYPKDIVDTKYPMVIREGQKHHLLEYGIPCWTIGALFEIMPSVIKSHNKKYYLTYFRLKEDRHYIYYLSSDPYRGTEERLELSYPDGCNTLNIFGETMIKAAFEMVVWLLKNGHIKTK